MTTASGTQPPGCASGLGFVYAGQNPEHPVGNIYPQEHYPPQFVQNVSQGQEQGQEQGRGQTQTWTPAPPTTLLFEPHNVSMLPPQTDPAKPTTPATTAASVCTGHGVAQWTPHESIIHARDSLLPPRVDPNTTPVTSITSTPSGQGLSSPGIHGIHNKLDWTKNWMDNSKFAIQSVQRTQTQLIDMISNLKQVVISVAESNSRANAKADGIQEDVRDMGQKIARMDKQICEDRQMLEEHIERQMLVDTER
jgi:hypothetical protein